MVRASPRARRSANSKRSRSISEPEPGRAEDGSGAGEPGPREAAKMIGRLGLLLFALLAGIAAASLIPPLSQSVRHGIGLASPGRAGGTASRDDLQGGADRKKTDAKSALVKIS